MEKLKPIVKQLRFRFDWKAYWEGFKAIHGEPMPFGARLLFPDGWMYSSTDYRGPEWAPGEDEVRLRRLYCMARRREIKRQLRDTAEFLRELSTFASTKSAPLMQVGPVCIEDGKPVREAVKVNLQALQDRVHWLESELVKAQRTLWQLQEMESSSKAT